MFSWGNKPEAYGLMAVLCHWITALLVLGLFVLGLWMTGLNYYSPWYQTGPDIHRSLGVLLGLLVVWRLMWRLFNHQPESLANHHSWEKFTAKAIHLLLYLLLGVMFVSGYLITTAEGGALDVFNLFSIPSLLTGNDLGVANLEDVAGEVHEIAAYTLIGLASLHAMAALKHHFIDKDTTLLRMFGKSTQLED